MVMGIDPTPLITRLKPATVLWAYVNRQNLIPNFQFDLTNKAQRPVGMLELDSVLLLLGPIIN
jgi:hypothetical protein